MDVLMEYLGYFLYSMYAYEYCDKHFGTLPTDIR